MQKEWSTNHVIIGAGKEGGEGEGAQISPKPGLIKGLRAYLGSLLPLPPSLLSSPHDVKNGTGGFPQPFVAQNVPPLIVGHLSRIPNFPTQIHHPIIMHPNGGGYPGIAPPSPESRACFLLYWVLVVLKKMRLPTFLCGWAVENSAPWKKNNNHSLQAMEPLPS